jgi:hypothetical protein
MTKKLKHLNYSIKKGYGGQCRTRTCDLLLVRQAL